MPLVTRENTAPYAVQEALVEVAGKAFWYKEPLRRALVRVGVPKAQLDKHADLGKYQLMRTVLEELDTRGASGAQVQRQLVRELAGIRSFGDNVDKAEARQAVDSLTTVGREHGMLNDPAATQQRETTDAASRRKADAQVRSQEQAVRRAALSEMQREYADLAIAGVGDRQARGYKLEKLLGRLVSLEGFSYSPPFRKGNVLQIDGHFHYDGHDYLIEARWRAQPPDFAALNTFAGKVANGLVGTRGLFVSIVGFRDESIAELERLHRNIVLMSGSELACVLEDRPPFKKALERKVAEASRRGRLFWDLTQ